MEIGTPYKVTPKAGLPPVESLLKTMLAKNMVDQVLGTSAPKSIDQLAPVIIEKADEIKDMHLDAYIAFDLAKTDSVPKYIHKSMNGALVQKVGAFARPCDVRALIELHKRRQVNLDNITLIGIEEHGRLDGKLLKKLVKDKKLDMTTLRGVTVREGKVSMDLGGKVETFPFDGSIDIGRNCANCSSKCAVNVDVSVSMIGDDTIVTARTVKGLDVLKQAGELLEFTPAGADPSTPLKAMEARGKEKQLKEIEAFRALPQADKMAALGKCTMCAMCIRACPVCFCVDCILQKKRKEKKIDQYTYQLTRIAHIADTCVQCGRCDAICPANLPLNVYFNDIAMKLESKFGYVAGRSLDDVPPRADISSLKMRFKK